jgi:hypothetical protein
MEFFFFFNTWTYKVRDLWVQKNLHLIHESSLHDVKVSVWDVARAGEVQKPCVLCRH